MFPFLFRKEIVDEYTQTNFKRLQDYFAADPVTNMEWKFFEIPAAAGTNFYPHRLGFVPKDIVVTYNSGNATITWIYTQFTDQLIKFTSSSPTVLRVLVGRYKDSQG